MNPSTLIEQAKQLGLTVSAADGRLSIKGRPSQAAKAVVTQLKQNEAAIVAYLAGPTVKPPLPAELWVEGIQTFAEAWARKAQLDESYRVALGGKPGAFYLVAPVEFTGKPVFTDEPNGSELASYIGRVVNAQKWQWLQNECKRLHGSNWTFTARVVDGGYKVTGLSAEVAPVVPQTELRQHDRPQIGLGR